MDHLSPVEHFMYPKSPQYRSPFSQHSPHRPLFQIQYKSLLRIRSHDTIVKGPDDVRLKKKKEVKQTVKKTKSKRPLQ
jgi:hypothetical protein